MPLKDAKGRFMKGDIIAHRGHGEARGLGDRVPGRVAQRRVGVRGLQRRTSKLNDKANYKGCFECHKPHEKMDYVISLAALRGAPRPRPPRPSPT